MLDCDFLGDGQAINRNMSIEKTVGVVAGAGPFAGLDLMAKILEQTSARKDQDHLAIVSLSLPAAIPDRTEFLLDRSAVNPAHAIVEQLLLLEKMGAHVAGIPCNSAHAAAIFDEVLSQLKDAGCRIMVLHMVKEVLRHLQTYYPHVSRVGVLSTIGTYRARLYPQLLEPAGIHVVTLDPEFQEQMIHPAIYDPVYGIKSCGAATEWATERLLAGGHILQERGAQAVILGCTEIPLAIRERTVAGMIVIDPTLILARALVEVANPKKLKPWI
jgi:aspartate racemase